MAISVPVWQLVKHESEVRKAHVRLISHKQRKGEKADRSVLFCFDSIRLNYFEELEMPTHCCVPECTKKGYREEGGTKVSFFKFPTENPMKKKWLHAIRRDQGKYFTVTENTKICSRHFREGDITKPLAGKNELRDGVVPSVFPWIRTSPRKRKEPAERNFDVTASKQVSRQLSSSAVVDVVEELANERGPNVPEFSVNFKNVETQTDLTDHEAYLT